MQWLPPDTEKVEHIGLIWAKMKNLEDTLPEIEGIVKTLTQVNPKANYTHWSHMLFCSDDLLLCRKFPKLEDLRHNFINFLRPCGLFSSLESQNVDLLDLMFLGTTRTIPAVLWDYILWCSGTFVPPWLILGHELYHGSHLINSSVEGVLPINYVNWSIISSEQQLSYSAEV